MSIRARFVALNALLDYGRERNDPLVSISLINRVYYDPALVLTNYMTQKEQFLTVLTDIEFHISLVDFLCYNICAFVVSASDR